MKLCMANPTFFRSSRLTGRPPLATKAGSARALYCRSVCPSPFHAPFGVFVFCCYMLFFALAHLVFTASFHLSESTTEPGLAFCSLGTRWHLVTRSDYSLGMRNDE